MARPRKTFGITLFLSQEGSLCDKEKVLHKGHFCSFIEKDRDLDPQGPPSCASAIIVIEAF